MNFLQTLFNPRTSPSMPFNPAGAPAMPQMGGNLQQMTQGAPESSRVAEIMQAIGQQPQTPAVQVPEQTPQRPRRSFLDTVGSIADVLARVGGAEALYQPTLDAREDRARQIDLEALRRQQMEQQLAIGGQALEAGEMEAADTVRSRAATALGALAENPDAASLWPQIAAQAGIDEQTTAQIGGLIQQGISPQVLARSLGFAPPEVRQGSQAKEVQIYQMLAENDPAQAQAYLQSLTNPGAMTEKQKADLGIALRGIEIREAEFDLKRQQTENPPESAQERTARIKLEQSKPKMQASLRSATMDIDKQIRDLQRLRNHPGLSGVTGPIAGRLPNVMPQTTAAQAILNTVLARGGFAALQDMRANSPTGGALGSVSDAEGIRLQNSVASLDQLQAVPDFQRAIDVYIGDLQSSKRNLQQAFEETYSGLEDAPASARPAARSGSGQRIMPRTQSGQRPGRPSREAIEAELRRRGRIQ